MNQFDKKKQLFKAIGELAAKSMAEDFTDEEVGKFQEMSMLNWPPEFIDPESLQQIRQIVANFRNASYAESMAAATILADAWVQLQEYKASRKRI